MICEDMISEKLFMIAIDYLRMRRGDVTIKIILFILNERILGPIQ